jgi:hypothetical protein
MSYIPTPMTASQIVSELNIDRRKLGQVLIQCKVIKQSGKIKYYLIQDVIKHLYNKTDKLISLEEARKNKAIAEAELLELNLEKEKGNVLDRDLVDKQWANLVLSCKNRLEAIPNKLAPILAVESGIDVCKNILNNQIAEALNELAKGEDIELTDTKDTQHGTKGVEPIPTERTANNKRMVGKVQIPKSRE